MTMDRLAHLARLVGLAVTGLTCATQLDDERLLGLSCGSECLKHEPGSRVAGVGVEALRSRIEAGIGVVEPSVMSVRLTAPLAGTLKTRSSR